MRCICVQIKLYVGHTKFNVQTEKDRSCDKTARTVYEQLKKQMNMRSMSLSSDEEGQAGSGKALRASKWVMEDMKEFREKAVAVPNTREKK